MKNMTETEGALKEHLMWVKKHYPIAYGDLDWDWTKTAQSAIKAKSDDSSMFKTARMKFLFHEMGVTHVRSSPYTQARNGRCERMVRTLKHAAAAMRASRGLGLSFWLLSLVHAAHIHDKLPTSSNPERKSPDHMITGQKPDITHLHIFGADSWINRHDNVQMGEDRALRGMYVGWDPESRSNLILVPPHEGGPEELKKYQNLQPGYLQKLKMRMSLRKTSQEHVTIDSRVPAKVLEGVIRPSSDLWVPYDEADDDEFLIIGTETVEIPTFDRGATEEGLLDLDYHATHCITTPANCACVGYKGEVIDGVPKLTRCAAVVIEPKQAVEASSMDKPKSKSFIDATKDAFSCAWDTMSGMYHYPKVCAVGECNSYGEAKNSQYSDYYEIAKDNELKQLLDPVNGVMEECLISEKPSEAKLFTSLMRFVMKMDSDNKIVKGKARLCFGGHKQVQFEHYDNASANCPRWSSIRLFIAHAAHRGFTLFCGDVTAAYLKGKDPKGRTQYMRSPPGMKKYKDGVEIIYKVTGNLYGMKQAGFIWSECLSNWLEADGFSRSKADPCVYVKKIIKQNKSSGAKKSVTSKDPKTK
jgi:hypothetical protein